MGKTGWSVSALSLGTVELGLRYGFYRDNEQVIPSVTEGVSTLLYGFENGINFLDTAPVYGQSEKIAGMAIKEWKEPVYVATKVGNPHGLSGREFQEFLRISIEESLINLNKERLDLVLIHNATASDFKNGDYFEVLEKAVDEGKVHFAGASVYGVDNALCAVEYPFISVLQVAFNVLDQRMALNGVFEKCRQFNVGIIVRSALLKGVLTERYRNLPPSLAGIKEDVFKVAGFAEAQGMNLADFALQFCLKSVKDASVLQGVRNEKELASGIESVLSLKLSDEDIKTASAFASDSGLIDPRNWDIP